MTIPYENTVSSSSIMDLLDNANTLGIMRQEIVFPEKSQLVNPDERVNEQRLLDLWQFFEENTKKQAYGLMLGQNITPSSKGPLASLVNQCKTLKDAFATFIKYSDWMNPSLHWEQIEHEDTYELVLTIKEGKDYPHAAIEKSMSSTMSWAIFLLADDIKPLSAYFEFNQKSYHRLYHSIFGDKLHFSSGKNSLIFSKDIFEKKLGGYNPFLKNVLEDRLMETIVKTKIKNIKNIIINKETIRELISIFLPNNKATAESVCNHLSISRQTLFRELKKENTSFQKILDEVRKHQSKELLLNKEYDIQDICSKLGYIEIRSFYTAFRRWHNSSVSQFRKELIIKK